MRSAVAGVYPERENRREQPIDRLARCALAALVHHLRSPSRQLAACAAAAEARSGAAAALDDEALRVALRRCARSDVTAERIAESLALVREAAARSLGLRPYPCQLLGAAALLQGLLAEMATGEGKSLTAALAAAVAASAGVPVHVVTVNDYLAARDAQEHKPLFERLGLTVGSVVGGMSLDARRTAYACDITYCTNKELVFDYLKDRVASAEAPSRSQWRLRALRGAAQPVLLLRGLHFAIIDEADSVLIDEARTPLILSREAGVPEEPAAYRQALQRAAALVEGEHYALHPERRELHLVEPGRDALAAACRGDGSAGGLWQVAPLREHFIEQALRAQRLFHRDQHYIVDDGEVQIVDEFTGRVLRGRRWEQGLQQLIETKEGVAMSRPAQTMARITYQRFFPRYGRLAAMTGTASEVAAELREVYSLEVVRIPTHRPSRRQWLGARALPDNAAKLLAVAAAVRAAHGRGQPVLVGTRSVAASEALSARLKEDGIAHELLNARQDADEAERVARAGQPGAVTVATNMAGRGTDIHLASACEAAGGLHVILTEYHESHRIDRQLVGRCARQGDRGSAEALVALDDELFTLQGGAWRRLLLASRRPVGLRLLAVLRAACQWRAGAHAARVRRETVRQERRMDDALAFAGQVR